MSELPFWSQILILMFLLVLSAFFSISETSLMAVNRYRMRHLAENGNRGAKQKQHHKVYAVRAAATSGPTRGGVAYTLCSLIGFLLPELLHLSWKHKDMYPEEAEAAQKKTA